MHTAKPHLILLDVPILCRQYCGHLGDFIHPVVSRYDHEMVCEYAISSTSMISSHNKRKRTLPVHPLRQKNSARGVIHLQVTIPNFSIADAANCGKMHDFHFAAKWDRLQPSEEREAVENYSTYWNRGRKEPVGQTWRTWRVCECKNGGSTRH